MKILILNDSHDKGNNPVRRIDNYHKSILAKLDETLQIAKDEKVDFIIHAGDVWHTPNVSWTIIDDWIDRIEEANINTYIVPGNHDMDGANWECSGRTALFHAFKRSKLLNFLDEIKTDNIYIKGYPYYYECEEDIKKDGLQHSQKNKLTIAVTHAFITPEPFPFSTHVLTKEIKTNYDFVVCSHLHKKFRVKENNTEYVNLGCFGRTAISEAKYTPQVGIIDTENKTYKEIQLKSAKAKEECFDLTALNDKKDFNGNIDKLIDSIGNTNFQGKTIEENIKIASTIKRVVKEVIEDIKTRIKAVQIESDN